VPWPLFVVLAVQAALSLRLIWANTAFLDEATYIWAGRIELWHLTSGSPVPVYATYFSGSPAIYPPLAGFADMVGGLVAARLLSLAFMLGTTCFLCGCTGRLFGRRAALCGAAVFVSLGSTQFLGALATYDAMALFLLTLSVWLVVVARDRTDSTLLLVGAVAALALANATKYATGLFDPVVVATAVITSPRGLKPGIARGGLIAGCTVGLIAGLLAIGGPEYLAGLQFTTLSRAAGGQSPGLVLADSARWTGVPVAIAAAGTVVAWWRDKQRVVLIFTFVVAGVLAPLNQARIHTTVSLSKHVDFGAWFACIAAGYAIAALSRMGCRRWLNAGVVAVVSALILAPGGSMGRAQASAFTHAWPNTTQIAVRLRGLARVYHGFYLAEDYDVPGYYLEHQVSWQHWQSTWYFEYEAPRTGVCTGGSSTGVSSARAAEAYTEAVAHQYFALIIVDFSDTDAVDHVITNAIHRYGTYHVVAVLPYQDGYGTGQYTVWARTALLGGGRGSSC
jgi:Dolichyl-phosphate-mannose-protein mannosyltransferase